jgi:hypothetical protein
MNGYLFGIAQKSLALVLFVALNMPARAGHIRADLPRFSKIEQF